MRRAAKRDISEKPIISALRGAGSLVMQLNEFDLLVLTPSQKLLMGECKTGNGKLTESQERLTEQGWPLQVWRNVDEALEAIE